MNYSLHLRAALAALALGLAQAATAAEAPAAAPADTAAAEPKCLQQTGTRLKSRDSRGCINGPGQVVTREEIQATGAITLGDALRRTVPSVN